MSIAKTVRESVRQMNGYVSGEQPDGGKFIKLNTNENPYPPSDKCKEAVLSAMEKLNVYPDAMANAFRLTASRLFGVEKDWILCGNGSDDLLTILTRTFVSSGSRIRIPYPSYVLYRTLAEIQGAETEEVHFNSDWSLPDRFSENDPALSLVFLPNPNSPSGTLIPSEKVLEAARSLNVPLVVDEAYVDFASSSCLQLAKEADNIIITRTLSKSYGLAGLRFGFAIARPEVIEQMQKVKDSYNCDSLSIAAATAAINDQQWLQQNTAIVRGIREQLKQELSRLGFLTVPSEANFVWCKHPEQDSRKIYEALKQNQILVRYMDYPDWGDGLRISVGTSSQVGALITVLQSILN